MPTDLKQFWGKADAWAARAKTFASCAGEGCNGCCRGVVAVCEEEADVVARRLSVNMWKAVRQAAKAANPRKERCPLLAPGGGCSVYDVRPATCRTYLVGTPSKDCYPEFGLKDVGILMSPELHEIMAPVRIKQLDLLPALVEWADAHPDIQTGQA